MSILSFTAGRKAMQVRVLSPPPLQINTLYYGGGFLIEIEAVAVTAET
jgi:hypothetical protein